jgi:NADPH-dependent glutamate synthase beta subunit-like oxidoreductase/NAD(P)H-flavin reductase
VKRIEAVDIPKVIPGLATAGLAWRDLFRPDRLAELHVRFLADLARVAPEPAARFDAYRASRGEGMSKTAISEVLVEIAPYVGAFVARLFGIEEARRTLMFDADAVAPIFRMQDQLVKRRALKRGDVAFDASLDAAVRALFGALEVPPDDELSVAKLACDLLDIETELKRGPLPDVRRASLERIAAGIDVARVEGREGDKAVVARALEQVERWLVMRRHDPELAHWMAFRLAASIHHESLVQLRRPSESLPETLVGPEEHARHRDGFRLTDRRMSRLEVRNEVELCLYCHDRDKDSCSKGFVAKDGGYRPSALGVPLTGCPLDEKISEAHALRRHGDAIAALALVAIDNPLMPGTGHRICNDCMRACIFQKQEPVNIPEVETGILTDVLEMPWGVEVYGLLTRWNPLDVRRPHALPYHGHDVLVVGLGPAGYTLAHHLVQEGFGVVAIDGLKLEPLPERLLTGPVERFSELSEELDERTLYGFGGVSEYGITVRWDKNFLTLLYATLARRDTLRMLGGVRFGGTLTLEDAWAEGFHHVAIASGAGKPTIIDLENNLIRGVRKASDFLMGLQLSGAAKRSTLAALQVRLPAIVIGGGLTAIDTATELRAYYVVQCEKMLAQWELVRSSERGDAARARFDDEEAEILDELLAHGRAIRSERELAHHEGRAPSFDALVESWGGVTVAYRKRLVDSPAYRLNHEEIALALEEGIRFAENLAPRGAVADEHGALRAVTFVRADGSQVELPARTLCIAAGTSPNTTYAREHGGTFAVDARGFFDAHTFSRDDGGAARLDRGPGFFTSYVDAEGRTVSFYGDNHPRYAGSVVRAMASAKDGSREVVRAFAPEIARALAQPEARGERERRWEALASRVSGDVRATVVAVNRLTPTIVEVVVHAPRQARSFRPGQFFRLQNFESRAARVDGTSLLMEGLALTGAWTDPERGLLALIVLEMGVSSRLCAHLTIGEEVVVMGPTGTPTQIVPGETVLLAGGGLGNAVLFSIAKAQKAAGAKVIYFAGYKSPDDVFKREEIEAATDQVIWSSDVGPAIEPHRAQDRAYVGNIVEAMLAFAKGELGERAASLTDVKRIIAIGSDRMMAAVAKARHGVLKKHLGCGHVAIGSINSPMQCMMKEVCAQCLQRHVDPVTGKPKSIVFTCFDQDQLLDEVDWQNLRDRLRQNTVQEKLAGLVLDGILAAGAQSAAGLAESD